MQKIILVLLINCIGIYTYACKDMSESIPDTIRLVSDNQLPAKRIWPVKELSKESDEEICRLFYRCYIYADTLILVCRDLGVLSSSDYCMSKENIYKSFKNADKKLDETFLPISCQITKANDTILYGTDPVTKDLYMLVAASIVDNSFKFSRFRTGQSLADVLFSIGLIKSCDYFKSFKPNYIILCHPALIEKYTGAWQKPLDIQKTAINFIYIRLTNGFVTKIFYDNDYCEFFNNSISKYFDYIYH